MGIIKKNRLRETEAILLLKKQERPSAPLPAEHSVQIPESLESPISDVLSPRFEEERKTRSQQLESEFLQKRQQADHEIAQLRQETQKEIESIKQKAYQEGLQRGQQEMAQQYQQKSQDLMATINDLVKTKNKVIREAEGEVLKLSLKIAEQIIRSEISLNQAVCLNIVAEALNKITDRDQVIIKVSSIDLEVIKRNRDRLASLIDGVKNFSIIEDSQVDPGGCIIETNLGYIDARMKTKLETLEAALLRAHKADLAAES